MKYPSTHNDKESNIHFLLNWNTDNASTWIIQIENNSNYFSTDSKICIIILWKTLLNVWQISLKQYLFVIHYWQIFQTFFKFLSPSTRNGSDISYLNCFNNLFIYFLISDFIYYESTLLSCVQARVMLPMLYYFYRETNQQTK